MFVHTEYDEALGADGEINRLGGLAPDAPGYDLRGCFVGSEGTMGIATRVAVRLTPEVHRRSAGNPLFVSEAEVNPELKTLAATCSWPSSCRGRSTW